MKYFMTRGKNREIKKKPTSTRGTVTKVVGRVYDENKYCTDVYCGCENKI